MEEWAVFALIAAIFISIRDIISYDIIQRLNYIDYLVYANLIVTIGLILYLVLSGTKVQKPNRKDLFIIFIRLLIIYLIIEPSVFYSLKKCFNPGYVKAIVNLNTIIVLVFSILFLQSDFSLDKLFWIGLVTLSSYMIIR